MLMPVLDWKEALAKRGVRIALIATGVVVGLSGIGVGGYYLWPEPAPKPPPPDATSTLQDQAEYAATEDFSRLPMRKRVAWVDKQITRANEMNEDEFVQMWKDLGPEKREQIRDNLDDVMEARVNKHADDYIKLPREERDAYLDKRIDEMQGWRKKLRRVFDDRRENRKNPMNELSPEERARERARRRAHAVREMREFMTEKGGARRAKMMKYFADMGKRRKERGMGPTLGRGRKR